MPLTGIVASLQPGAPGVEKEKPTHPGQPHSFQNIFLFCSFLSFELMNRLGKGCLSFLVAAVTPFVKAIKD